MPLFKRKDEPPEELQKQVETIKARMDALRESGGETPADLAEIFARIGEEDAWPGSRRRKRTPAAAKPPAAEQPDAVETKAPPPPAKADADALAQELESYISRMNLGPWR